jgi:hypothetical protein
MLADAPPMRRILQQLIVAYGIGRALHYARLQRRWGNFIALAGVAGVVAPTPLDRVHPALRHLDMPERAPGVPFFMWPALIGRNIYRLLLYLTFLSGLDSWPGLTFLQ